MNDLITPISVRKYLNISRTTLWKFVKNGDIPVIRLSKNGKAQMRFRPEEIEKFLKDREENV